MRFMPHKALKDQVVVDFLANHLVPQSIKLYDDLLDEVVKLYNPDIL